MSYNSKYKSSEIEAILDSVEGKQDEITDLATIRSGAAKGATALQSEQYKGTVTGVKINGTTKSPSSGVVDLGTVITSHQDISGKQDKLVSGTNIKTINGTSLLGSGNITISGGSSSGSGAWKSERIPRDSQYLKLSPFTLYYGGIIFGSLSIEFDTESYDYADYRALMYLSPNSSLTLDGDVLWANGSPQNFEDGNYELNVTYDDFEGMFFAVLTRFSE